MPRFSQSLSLPEVQRRLFDRLTHLADEPFEVRQGTSDDPTNPAFDWEDLMNAVAYQPAFTTILEKDLAKVAFDLENIGVVDAPAGPFAIVNGVPMLFAWAGGDWEWPVHFFLYVDPKGSIRGYVPEHGNRYNHARKAAYGNHEDGTPEGDEADMAKRYGTGDWNFSRTTPEETAAMVADATARIKSK